MPTARMSWTPATLVCGLLCFLCCMSQASAADKPAVPQWLGSSPVDAKENHEPYALRKQFELSETDLKRLVSAECEIWTDHAGVWVEVISGKQIARTIAWLPAYQSHEPLDLLPLLKAGKNEVRLLVDPVPGPTAVAAAIRLVIQGEIVLGHGGPIQQPSIQRVFATDRSWQLAPLKSLGPQGQARLAGDTWRAPTIRGSLAAEDFYRATHGIEIKQLDDYNQWKQALQGSEGPDPAGFQIAAGFEITEAQAAGEEDGSWISLTVDPQGRLLVGREDQGILRFTLVDGKVTRREPVNETLRECRGLAFVGKDLYVHANEAKGLFRLRDTTGDDQFDEVTQILEFPGSTGHGRNDLAVDPQGRLHGIYGDSVETPTVERNHTSPLREYRPEVAAQQGFVLRIHPDAATAPAKAELMVTGLRNPYGLAFNRAGDMFTYDADAEFDMGSPWYRPTRVHHLLPGGDYGWRRVTGRWPPYVPDHPLSAPPTRDIGKGSPTSVKFGDRNNFPAPYQDALYVLDWAYGRVLAVHCLPYGGSYRLEPETFLKGRPLNVTDLEFGPDGAMYIATGGRKTHSALYRVTAKKPDSERQTATATEMAQRKAREEYAATQHELRRKLESFHRVDSQAIDQAWIHLSSADPAIRYAARVAVEHQPMGDWKALALSEQDPGVRRVALMALAQAADRELAQEIFAKVLTENLSELPPEQLASALHTLEVCLDRAEQAKEEEPLPAEFSAATAELEPLFPHPVDSINRQVVNLLARFDSPVLVPRVMQQLATTTRQKQRMHYFFVLRNVRSGWTPRLREDYLTMLGEMNNYIGGEGMPGFVEQLRENALGRLPAEAWPDWMQRWNVTGGDVELDVKRPLVKEWDLADLSSELGQVSTGRNFAQGEEMFAAAQCIRCHRLSGKGGVVGPDLTSAGSRYTPRNLLESVLKPSLVVADNYRTDLLVTEDGRVLTGRIVPSTDYRSSLIRLAPNPLKPSVVEEVPKDKILEHHKSTVSIMPEKLLDTLTSEQILDLLAYVLTAGDASHPCFEKTAEKK